MDKERAWGLASAVGAFTLWGFLPIYWKLVQEVPALEILAHRFIWSLVFLALFIFATKRIGPFCQEVRAILARPGKILGVVAAATIITFNWLTYIWAVNNDRIVETSLGYYMTPLISVLLGVVVLKERLSFWQTVSVLLAAAGVLNLTFRFGVFPWVAVSLAVSFGLYGLCKKLLNIGAINSITLETLLVSPLAFLYLAYLHHQGVGALSPGHLALDSLLIGTGVVTAIPMVLFSAGAIRLPLTVIGFIQYFSPTIALFVGIFLYGESFSPTHLLSFSLIWLALAIFSLSKTKPFLRLETLIVKKTPCPSDE